MKTLNSLTKQLLLLLITMIFLLSSCGTTKKTAVDCPDLTTRMYHKPVHRVNNDIKLFAFKTGHQRTTSHRKSQVESITFQNVQDNQRNILNINKAEYNGSLTASIVDSRMGNNIIPPRNSVANEPYVFTVEPDQEKHDTIVARSGAKYIGKVIEIGLSEVKYKRWDNLEGPVISLKKTEIEVIKYSNGTNDYFTSNDYIQQTSFSSAANANYTSNDTRINQGLGVAGFITSLAGLIVFGILLGTLSVIFGGVSLGKINREPKRYKGRGFAITAIILGLVDIIGVLIILASMA